MIRLGVNLDHVATVRQARGELYPDPVQAAAFAQLGGADNITCHLREDRRHISDRDVRLLKETLQLPFNFEMAAVKEMVDIALVTKPAAVTIVPERRAERTTEGGLDLHGANASLRDSIGRLRDAGIVVALFIEPDPAAVDTAAKLGAHAVEFHTGRFCRELAIAHTTRARVDLTKRLGQRATQAAALGLQAHFGHGLNYTNAHWLQLIPEAEEANIGHAIIAQAVFVGLQTAVAEMKIRLNDPLFRPTLP